LLEDFYTLRNIKRWYLNDELIPTNKSLHQKVDFSNLNYQWFEIYQTLNYAKYLGRFLYTLTQYHSFLY
jgi:6-pyruvoyl-tetrahydropterin synthase